MYNSKSKKKGKLSSIYTQLKKTNKNNNNISNENNENNSNKEKRKIRFFFQTTSKIDREMKEQFSFFLCSYHSP
jgi:hypothetical protein